MRTQTMLKSIGRRLGLGIERLTPAKLMARDAYFAQSELLRRREVRVIFDVGANTGQTALQYLPLFPLARIYSFEPFDLAFSQLSASLSGVERVRPHKLAISDRTGQRGLFLQTENWNNSLLPAAANVEIATGRPSKATGQVAVSTTTLDDFCDAEGIDRLDILKMDIQGGELMALRGAERLLRRGAIALIYTEVLFADLYDGQANFADLFALLRDSDYVLFGLYDLIYPPGRPLAWGDAIFIHRDLQHGLPVV